MIQCDFNLLKLTKSTKRKHDEMATKSPKPKQARQIFSHYTKKNKKKNITKKKYLISYKPLPEFGVYGDNVSIYSCKNKKIMSLESVNWMKAHNITFIAFCIDYVIPEPEWWDNTGIEIQYYGQKYNRAINDCEKAISEIDENCALLVYD